MVKCFVMCPNEYIGDMMPLIDGKTRRGRAHGNARSAPGDADRRVPLNEILVDFNDQIKALTHGYGSMDYEHVRLSRERTWLSWICSSMANRWMPFRASCIGIRPRARAGSGGQIEGSHSAASSFRSRSRPPSAAKSSHAKRVGAFRKNVTAKCYGGDITRKRKLLEKQKEGKKRMKALGGQYSSGSVYRSLKTS